MATFVRKPTNGGGTVSVEELNQRLSKDEEFLREFNDMLGKSNTLTGNVCSLLDDFQERIDSLSANVSTLYAKSSVIQKEQQSIRKLLSTVDATIQFHGKSTVLENTIRDGGNVLLALDDYLEKMRNLKEAIAFFSSHPTYRDQLEHIRQIYEIGCTNIESEFGNLVRLNCVAVDPAKVFDCLDEDYEMPSFRMSSFLTLRDTQRIHQMAVWLLANTECSQFLQFYAQCRAENMMRPLRAIADQIGANNRVSKMNFVKTCKPDQIAFGAQSGPIGAEKWRKVLRYGKTGNQDKNEKIVMMRLTSKCEAIKEEEEEQEEKGFMANGSGKDKDIVLVVRDDEIGKGGTGKGEAGKSENESSAAERQQQEKARQFATAAFRLFALKKAASRIADSNDQAHRDNAVAVVLFLFSTALVLVQLETDLASTVFSNVKVQADVLRQIIREPLGRVLAQTQKVLGAYEGNFAVLIPLARFQLRHQNQLSALCHNVGEHTLFATFQSSLFHKCVQLIKLYLERLTNDQIGGRFVPEDGNVHPVSSATINFLKLLVQNHKLIAQIYQRAAEEALAQQSKALAVTPSKLFVQILTSLGVNLRHKCNAYSDTHLGALFMFNNLSYIAQCCAKDKLLLSNVQQCSPQLLSAYESEAETYLSRYLESWAKIGALFAMENGNGGWETGIDEKKAVKSVFSSFNREFDTIIEAQKKFCLADQTMAKEVRRRIKELVLRPYIEFSTRNSRECSELFETDHQLKYDAETVEMVIERLFDATF